MAMTARLRLGAAALGALTLVASLAGCSSTPAAVGSTTTSTTAAVAEGEKPVCSLITPAEIHDTMGMTVDSATVAVGSDVTTCTYKASDVSQSVIIQYQTGATASSFAATKARITSKDGSTTPISNLGDQAYSSMEDEGGNSVDAVALLSGSLQIVVISAAELPKVETLAAFTLDQVQTSGGSSSPSSTG